MRAPSAALQAALLFAAAADAAVLSDAVERLVQRSQNGTAPLRRAGSVAVVRDVAADGADVEYGVCHIPAVLPLLARVPSPLLQTSMAVHLAIQHLNDGNGSVVSEIAGLNSRCNVRFTTEILASSKSTASAVELATGALDAACALATGPPDETVPLAVLSGARGVPHISPIAGDDALDDKGAYPTFARTATSELAKANAFVDYLCHEVGTRRSVVVHEQTPGKVAKVASLLDGASIRCPEMNIVTVSIRDWFRDGDYPSKMNWKNAEDYRLEVERALSEIEDSGHRHIFSVTSPQNLMTLLRVGADVGAAIGPEYFWAGAFPKLNPVEEGSALHEALPGFALVLPEADLFSGDDDNGAEPSYDPAVVPRNTPYDRFARAFAGLYDSPEDMEFLLSRLPEQYESIPRWNILTSWPAFTYDAVVAVGLAACAVAGSDEEKDGGGGGRGAMGKGGDMPSMGGPSMGGMLGMGGPGVGGPGVAGPSMGNGPMKSGGDVGAYFDGLGLYEQLMKTSFHGTTGTVEFDRETGSRDPTSAIFTIANWQADEPVDGMVGLSKTTTHLYRNGVWTERAKFVYNGGSTVAPADSATPEVDYNYIGAGLRAAGLVLCAIVLGLSAGWALWAKYYEKKPVVKASQPIFLWIICAGTFLMGSAIIPMSIDDEIASEEGCNIACMAVPWLLAIGFALIFSALFAKLLRVNKLFNNKQMRRIKVEAVDVIKPLVALMCVNILVLGLWTGLSPLEWEREVTAEDDLGKPTESLGMCKSDGALPYAIALVVIDLAAMVLALYQAYLCRKIAVEFAESAYIASAIGCILLVSFVGIPVIIIANDQPRARFFVMASIIFVICTSLLLFIFVPKEKYRRNNWSIKESIRARSRQETSATLSRLNTGGSDGVSANGSIQTGRPVNQSSGSSSSDEGGLRILNDPHTIQTLEQENAALRRKNEELQRLVDRRSSTLPEIDESWDGSTGGEHGET